MIRQSWGHSGGLTGPAAGELDLARDDLETSYVGRRILARFDRYPHGRKGTDTGPAFAYYGNRGVRPVTVTSTPEDTGVLELPVTRGSLG